MFVTLITLAYKGVGRSIKIMNYKFFSMKNTFLKKVAPMLAVFALTISVLNFGSYDPYNELTVLTPEVAQAQLAVSDLDLTNLDLDSISAAGFTNSSYTNNYSFCKVTASANTGSVEFGSSVTLTWSTENAATITINGEPQDALSGSRTFHNIQANTTYTLRATTADGKANCSTTVNIQCVPPVVVHPLCEMTPVEQTINSGESANLTWSTTNAVSATLTSFGTVGLSGTQSTGPLSTTTSYTLTAKAQNGETVQCHSIIKVKPPVEEILPSCDAFTAAPTVINQGQSSTLTWATTNATNVVIDNGVGVVAASGSVSVSPLGTTTYTLTASNVAGKKDTCTATVTVTTEEILPSCDAFTATPTVIQKGQSATLAWATTNATRVVIDNAIGEVAASGTLSVSPLATTTYMLTAFGTGDNKDTCTATVIVKDTPVETLPSCVAFTATPTTLPVGGGNVALAWETKDATSVSISPIIGSVATTGTTSVSISTTTTYTLTASNVDGEKDTCAVTIVVPPPTSNVITCADNVTISVADPVIRRGNSTTLNWSTTGITGVTFDNGITSTALSGSTTVTPSVTTTYTLTATDGTTSVACPVTVRVDSGGGGG